MDLDDFQVECLLDIRALTIRCDRASFSVCLARQLSVIGSSGSDVAVKTVEIGTTATDAESGTLVVTVSSTTHLVNTVISIHSITLSSVADLFGTTTLTVRARDAGGVFVSTELVVIVASVNDTPTLTVSPNMVTVGLKPVVVNVAAFDVEDTTLSFSVSSGQGIVSTVITTTSFDHKSNRNNFISSGIES